MSEKRYTAKNDTVHGTVRSGRSYTKREIGIGQKLGVITGTIKHDNLNGAPFWGTSKKHHCDELRRKGEMYLELAAAVEREWDKAPPYKVMSNGVAVQILNHYGKQVEIKVWDYHGRLSREYFSLAADEAINEYFGIKEVGK